MTPTAIAAPPFFTGQPAGTPGLAVFLNAGDPPLDVLRDVVAMLDESRVDCLELAVPFPDSVTDGPVIRDSAGRALARGVGLEQTLRFVADVRPGLSHLRIALLADWSHTVRPITLEGMMRRAADARPDALLLHGLPPLYRRQYYEAAQRHGLSLVTTCYARSAADVMADSARHASGYLYLVAHHGRTGTAPRDGYACVAAAITRLRTHCAAPIAVGFGVRDTGDVRALRCAGADAVVVGSAAVSRVARAQVLGRDVPADLQSFLTRLRPVYDHES